MTARFEDSVPWPRLLTPPHRGGSEKIATILATALIGCASRPADSSNQLKSKAITAPTRHSSRAAPPAPEPPPGPEASLGVVDRGIFSDLDPRIQIALPSDIGPERAAATVDPARQILVLYDGEVPVKVYPIAGGESLPGAPAVRLRPGDRAELEPLLDAGSIRTLAAGEAPPPGDADDDGIPDPLDLLIGALKAAENGAAYGGGYRELDYPGGDVPRDVGVCTDVVVRSARNAGLDLQEALHRDLLRSRSSYPMVRQPRGNPSIDHRRVKTLLPYFERHWRAVGADQPLRPGDVIFFDTFPSRSGPDHIGVASHRSIEGGRPLVINNWTDGTRTVEMDLLAWVPVTHRFRFPSPCATGSNPGCAGARRGMKGPTNGVGVGVVDR